VKATVIKSTGNNITVQSEGGEIFNCVVKGNFRIKNIDATNPVAVGDRVEVELKNDMHLITGIDERKNYIIRKSVKLSKQVQILATNVDMAYIIATPVLPKTSTGFIDRFLATAEAYNIPASIIFNKADLYESDLIQYVNELCTLYNGIGYTSFIISSLNKNDVEMLTRKLKGKVNLFAGHSGVGKSTLINKLIPDLNLKIGKISDQHLTGTHTTTYAEMHPLPQGGYIIDTPGIREFGTFDFIKHEITYYFPEFFKLLPGCKFHNCLHLNEKDCAVISALHKGEIAESRYRSYISIVNNEDIFK
jgi:ribosome biogenesis GTPase